MNAIAELANLRKSAEALKAERVVVQDDESANKLFCYQTIIDTLSNELQMWVALKDNKPDLAWTCLVEAQMAASHALSVHSVALDLNLERHLDRLDELEKRLFPPQIFSSVGTVIKHSYCSICKADYGDCNHIKGRVYKGEMCTRVIDDVELREISIVNEPASKHCRMLNINGRNTLTGLTEKPNYERLKGSPSSSGIGKRRRSSKHNKSSRNRRKKE